MEKDMEKGKNFIKMVQLNMKEFILKEEYLKYK